MNNQPHRDIFSGIVATELAKNGYFGQEINYYSYLFWDKEVIHIVSYENETICIKNMLAQLNSGLLVSDYVHFKKRVYDEETLSNEQIKKEAQQIAWQTLIPTFNQSILEYQERKENLKEKEIEVFFQVNHNFSLEAKRAFLGKALRKKWISNDFYEKYDPEKYSTITENLYSNRELYGFVWIDGEIKTYCNSYLPTVWDKYIIIQKENHKTSSILSKKSNTTNGNVSIQLEKNKFKDFLKTIFEQNYFTLLAEIEK